MLIRGLGRQGRTVLLSSHLLGEVQQVSTRVGVIAEGRLLREGTVGELLDGDSRNDRFDKQERRRDMHTQMTWSGPRWVTVAGLVAGAVGIAILWASGIPFPFVIPPGIVILLGGAVFVGLARWRWAPAVGAFLGLFIIVGFLLSPSGVPNLLGENGAGVVVGTVVQMVGVLVALIAGVAATWRNYRGPVAIWS